mgnify:FL=1
MNDLPKISVGFFGTPDFSLQFLKNLFQEEVEIKFVVSQPATKSGRGKRIKLSAVEEWAIEKDIPTYTPKKTNEVDFLEMIKLIKVDFIIVVAYGNMVCDEIINHPKYQTINVHASLLPKWRGAAPIQRSLINGDQETGVTIMKIVKKLDAGPIISNVKFKIKDNDTAGKIYERIIKLGNPLLTQTILEIFKDEFVLTEQQDEDVSYAKKIEKSETKIIWSEDAHLIDRKIRAFNPKPGAWTTISLTKKRIKINKSKVISSSKFKLKPEMNVGESLQSLVVKCGKDFLQIIELQPEGKKKMTATDFLNGLKNSHILFD